METIIGLVALGFLFFIYAIIYIIQSVGLSKVFEKVGIKEKWKAWIPLYQMFELYGICWLDWAFILYFIFNACSNFIGDGAIIWTFLSLITSIIVIFINAYAHYQLGKAFRTSTGITILLILVPIIGYFIIGGKDYTYYGLPEDSLSKKLGLNLKSLCTRKYVNVQEFTQGYSYNQDTQFTSNMYGTTNEQMQQPYQNNQMYYGQYGQSQQNPNNYGNSNGFNHDMFK